MNRRKILQKALSGSRNMRFAEMVALVEAFGFRWARTSSSHHIYSRRDIPELINLQNVHEKAKPHQVHQFLKLAERYNLVLEEDQ